MHLTDAPSNRAKWDLRMLALARHIATWSKDPSTAVGAVVADHLHRVIGVGYNGFPRGVKDLPERLHDREVKYSLVVHAELNALLNATASVELCTLYAWPLPICPECAKTIVQLGVARVVTVDRKWETAMRPATKYTATNVAAELMLREAEIEWKVYDSREVTG